jgi:hypothetical protein
MSPKLTWSQTIDTRDNKLTPLSRIVTGQSTIIIEQRGLYSLIDENSNKLEKEKLGMYA